MKLENQVCSLELSRKLKELGVKQESFLYYVRPFGSTSEFRITEDIERDDEIFSAFTVAELGELLKKSSYDMPWYIEDKVFGDKGMWQWSCLEEDGIENTEADARAKMLIYLLENELYEKEK